MALPSLPKFDEIKKERQSTPQSSQIKIDDLPEFSLNKPQKQTKKITPFEETTQQIKRNIASLGTRGRGTSAEAEIIDSNVLFNAPEDYFDKYNRVVEFVTTWIQNEMSKETSESSIIQSLKKDPTNIENREIAFKSINRHFIAYETQPTYPNYNIDFNSFDKSIILALTVHEICGLGPLEPLFRDFNLKELVCNGPFDIQVEKGGKMRKVPSCKFRDGEHLKNLIDRLYNSVNKQITKAAPMERARLHDNSRIFAVDKSVAPNGPSLNIRRHTDSWFAPTKLLEFESASKEMLEWLGSHINAEFNFIVAGGTATGKSLSLSTPIPTPEGWKFMGNLLRGDKVFDMNGKVTTVTNIFDQEKREVYEIHFYDANPVKCDLEHNWIVIEKTKPYDLLTLTTKEIIDNGSHNYLIPLLRNPVEFDLMNYKYETLLFLEIPILVRNFSEDKYDLLKEYEFTSPKTRIELLKEFCKYNENFEIEKDSVLHRIVRSLGYGNINDFKDYYFENKLPIAFQEIKSIERTNVFEKMRCITVDSDTHSYLFGEEYTVTHNTTLLAALTGFYRNDARLLTVERNIELRPAPGKLWGTPMEVIPPNPGAATSGVDMRTLVEATTQMRPDGIILGETTGPEAWDVTQALNSGHFGATTIHANSAEDTIQRLVALISQSDVIKGEALLEMIASSFDIIVITTRFPQDGSRKITSIREIDTKVTKNEAGLPHLKVIPIWEFQPDEFSKLPGSKVRGEWVQVGRLSEERSIKHNLDMIKLKKWDELIKLYEGDK